MFEDKPCEKSLGLELSLRASSLYADGTFMFEDKPCEKSLGQRSWYNKGREKCVRISPERRREALV